MIFLIILIILFVLIVYIDGFSLFAIVMPWIWASLLLMIIAPVATAMFDYEYVEVEKYHIKAFNGEYGVQGSFILGSGNINENYSYYYLTEENDSGVKLKKIDSNRATVYEINTAPYIVNFKPQYTNKIVKWLFMIPIKDNEYKIYIPKGSIKYEYNLEL